MSLHGELTGAAARRQVRRLRSWLRHERQTVAMVLAEACHHSSGTFPPTLKERRMAGQDAYEALRGQKTARTAGLHSDELVEPGVQGRAVTVGYVAARVPTLAGHRLTSDDDGVDGRTVRFLLKQSLTEKKKEWEEERRRLVQESVEQVRARVDPENAARHAASSSTGKRRKRKKRKKKKLPRGSSRSLARRRQRQWYVCKAGFPGDVILRAVLPSVVVRPEMLGIMASMNQKDNTTLVDYLGLLVLLVTMHLALCFLLVSPSPGCSASWPVWTRRIIAVACTRLVFMVNMLLAFCSLPWSAGPGCSSSWPLWTRRTVASRSTCFRKQRNAWTSCYMLCVSLRMRLGRISHIFSMKVTRGDSTGAFVGRGSVIFKVVDILVFTQMLIPMVLMFRIP